MTQCKAPSYSCEILCWILPSADNLCKLFGSRSDRTIFFQPDLDPNCLTFWGYSWKNFGEEAYTANAYHTSSTSMRLSSLSALYFLGHVTWQNICKTKKKPMIHVNKLEEVPVTKSVVLHSLSPPLQNDDVDICKRTGGGTFKNNRSSFKFPLPPPPSPHTHTKRRR